MPAYWLPGYLVLQTAWLESSWSTGLRVYCLAGNLGACLTGWQAIYLSDIWSTGWLVDWLQGYLVTWLPGYLVAWLLGKLVSWLPGYLINSFTQLPGCLVDFFTS